MSDFFRRMISGTVINFSPDSDGAPDAGDPAAAPAGGAPADPDAGSPPADSGTAAGDTPGGDGTVQPSPAADASTGEVPPAPQPDAQQRRMNQLVAERWAERRRAEESEQRSRLLQEQLNQTRAALQAQPQVDANGNPIVPQAPVQPVAAPQDIQRMAADIAAQNDFNRQVQEEVTRGRTSHQDFDQVASTLQQFGELPRTFVEAALATGKGADVMYALGKDPLEASRILTLPPIQQAVALASLAGALKAPVAPKIISSAPAPAGAPKVGGGKTTNTPSLEDPNLPIADFIRMRDKDIAAQKGQRSARR